MKKHTIIGMAGHIDHGKTALIKQLTGIQTDQHKEERERGITIDIGFAYWKDDVTIIDVPGHEKFIRNMVAGVSTVDLFILVIAADDGIMPQTIEHLDILKFLGVKDGVVVINKIDLVDEEWLMLVQDDIESFMKKNGFGHVPVIPVSALEDTGISDLRALIDEKIEQTERRIRDRPARINIDRSFIAKGYGSIITGTLLSARLKEGDKLEILPQGKETRLRSLQVHQHDTNEALAGQRVAINLPNISVDEITRGAVLVKPDTLISTQDLLAEITTTNTLKLKLKRYANVRVHLGTAEIMGRINWFEDAKHLEPNQQYHIRIKLTEPAVAAPDDPVLIRTFSPLITFAGGRVLEINPPGMMRIQEDWQSYFEILRADDLQVKIMQVFRYADFKTFTEKDIQKKFFENKQIIAGALENLVKKKALISFESKNATHYAAVDQLDRATAIISDTIDKELGKSEFKRGINLKELVNKLRNFHISQPFLDRALERGLNKELFFSDGNLYFNSERKDTARIGQHEKEVSAYYKQARFNPPDIPKLSKEIGIDQKNIRSITLELAKRNELKSINGQFYLHSDVFDDFIRFLKEYFRDNEQLGIAAVKEFTGSTRKWIIPLMEYADGNGLTVRAGDVRTKGMHLDSV